MAHKKNQVKNIILQERNSRDMSRWALMKKAGVSYNAILELEQSQRDPHVSTAIRVAKALGSQVEDIFTIKEEE